MPEMTTITVDELARLQERARKLAQDKSYLKLILNLMNKVSTAQGLDNMIETLLSTILDVIGGTNIILYYRIDDDLYYADLFGKQLKLDRIDDDLVQTVFDRREPMEHEQPFGDTQMLTPEFTNAYTWVFPLLAGSELIGVLKLENLHIGMRKLYGELPTFFTYVATVLKNEIFGHTRLKRAYDQLNEINAELQLEVAEREQAEDKLRLAKGELEERVKERTGELQLANERLQQELAERERAQEALRRSAEEVQDLYDHAPCGYHSLDSDGTIIRINDTELQWLGYRRDEVLGKMRFSDLITESSLQTFREHFPSFMEKGWHRDLEYEMVRRDGTILPVLLSATALYDDDGNYLMSRSTIYDMTERRKAEEKEHLLSSIVQSSDDAIIAKDLDGIILSWNRGAERIFGYSAEEAVGKSVAMVIPPDHPDELAEILTQLRRGERIEHYTTERLRKDGQRIFIALTVSPILDGEGNVVAASSIARDITGQVHAEEALRKSERELKEAQRIAHIGSWDWNATTDIIIWSEEYHRIYNVDPNLPAPNYREHLKIYTPESAERLAAEVAKAMQTGEPYGLELELANPDASRRWIFARGEAKYDADGEIVGLHGTAQDITQRKLAEAEILRLNADLEQRVLERTNELEKTYHELEQETAQRLLALEELREKERLLLQQSRLAALGEMISNIAHQWRQPLNELGLIVQELPMMYEKGNLDRDYLKASVAKFMKLLSHTSRTIDDFRDFFKPDEEKVPFKVQEMVEKTVSLIEESFRQLRIAITVTAAGEPVINGHPNEFSQVMLNILFNARDAFLARKDDRPRVIAIEIFSQGGRGVVTVADNAGGIPEEILEKIFDPYFTTRGPDQGIGIGLYMSKIIIEKNMPGRLSARNTADGAEFRIEV
jgi:PAS domain S-box-containing protein